LFGNSIGRPVVGIKVGCKAISFKKVVEMGNSSVTTLQREEKLCKQNSDKILINSFPNIGRSPWLL